MPNFDIEYAKLIIVEFRAVLLIPVTAHLILTRFPAGIDAGMHRYDFVGQFIVFSSGLSFIIGRLGIDVGGIVVPK